MAARRAASMLLALLLLALSVPGAWCADAGATIEDGEPEYAEAAAAQAAEEAKPVAVLIARKHVLSERVLQGRNMTIAVTVYNVGKGSAENVRIQDLTSRDDAFSFVAGDREQSFSTIDAGRSAQLSYVAVPKRGQRAFLAAPALITYSAEGSQDVVKTYSTTPVVPVLSSLQSFEAGLVKLGQVVSLGVLKTSRDWYNSAVVLALAAAGAVCFVVVSKASQTQAESRRKAAVRDLGLE